MVDIIHNVNFSQSGEIKFIDWVNSVALGLVTKSYVKIEVLGVLTDRLGMGDQLSYELGGSYTKSGNPEIIYFDESDIYYEIETE